MKIDLPTYNMGYLTYPDIQEYLKHKDIVMVPVGSFEQHSYHLPLLTDTIGGIEIASRAGEAAQVLYTPEIWLGYSPHHMGPPGLGLGTITVRSSTFLDIIYDVCRSLIHHGFNKILIVNDHGSNMKIIDPVIRAIKYDTGAWIGVSKLWVENYLGLVKDLLEGPPEETPGWHAGEYETSMILAHDERLVRMERAVKSERTKTPAYLPDSFFKKDGTPTITFEGYSYFVFPMEHREFSDTGLIGNPFRGSRDKGLEAYRRFSEHLVRALKEFEKIKVEVKNRDFTQRALE
jgi:creatinine amidohydrolase